MSWDDVSDPEFDLQFQRMLERQGLSDPTGFRQVETFDEVPVYSRLSELDFMSSLPIVDQNRLMILAAARHLITIGEDLDSLPESDPALIVLVSMTSWWIDDDRAPRCNDGTIESITPRFWVGDLAHPDMKALRFHPPRSNPAKFVIQTVGLERFEVVESTMEEWMQGCPERVYIARAGDIPATARG
ncbi:Imm15 family immunity protein [Kribbella sp. NPDC006257]|uniref:Imm15 family immunity protein n=1 Tax=Kribbella sp. NPDC006257 TaxID=3156738 RepID=UPI0033AA7ECC